MTDEDRARRAALEVVEAVATAGAYANLLLPAVLRRRRLSGRDAAFATELAYGTLRWQGSLDAVLASCSSRALTDLDPPVLAVLRLGAYQALLLRVPAHAAVSTSVTLVRARSGPRPAGLVNAVLRRVAARPWPEWVDALAPAPGVDRLALAYGFPAWIVETYATALGVPVEAPELLAALSEDRPVTHLVALPGRIDRGELAAAVAGGSPGPYSPYAVRLHAGGDPGALPAVRSGVARVQDEGSQLAALALLRPALAGADGRWLDMCAGPGGKAALLAAEAAGRGARLVAADVQAARAGLVAQALRGPGLGPPVALAVQADARWPAWPQGAFDRVLLDAPCTGLGALRRRPELRWRRRPEDAARLAALQRSLLDAALDSVRPGGVVAYVTCSPHRAETTAVVAAALADRDDARALDTPALLGVPAAAAGKAVQLWAHRHGTDAMFVALLQRSEPLS